MTTKEQTKIEAVPVFLRPILSMAFWSSVMVGVFPAALSTLLPIAGNCELEGGKPNLFCQMGLVRATFVLESVPWTFYAAVTIIGLLAGVALRWRIALLALAPTALLATITWLEISARTFTPEYPETIQDISWFTDNRAHSRMSSAEAWAKMQSPFSTPDTTRLELAYVMLSNEALLLDLELIARSC